MTPHEWIIEAIYYVSKADRDFYDWACSGLPGRAPEEPYHLGPHNMPSMRAMVSALHPKKILQIGFNLGHSTAMLLALKVESITSVDIRLDKNVQRGITAIEKKWPGKHSFIHSDSATVSLPDDYRPDVIFIDGGHEYAQVFADIKLGRKHQCKDFFFDDWYAPFGPGVQPAIADSKLVPMAIWGDMAWCVEPEKYGMSKGIREG